MKTNTRFIKNAVETAKTDAPTLPWARGARRAAFIAKRTSAPAPLRNSAVCCHNC